MSISMLLTSLQIGIWSSPTTKGNPIPLRSSSFSSPNSGNKLRGLELTLLLRYHSRHLAQRRTSRRMDRQTANDQLKRQAETMQTTLRAMWRAHKATRIDLLYPSYYVLFIYVLNAEHAWDVLQKNYVVTLPLRRLFTSREVRASIRSASLCSPTDMFAQPIACRACEASTRPHRSCARQWAR